MPDFADRDDRDDFVRWLNVTRPDQLADLWAEWEAFASVLWCRSEDPDECALIREREVAGISDHIPGCPVHGTHPTAGVAV